MPANTQNPDEINAFPPPRKMTLILDEFRNDLREVLNELLGLTPGEVRLASFGIAALQAAKAQRDDLRGIIHDFLRLARAETADPTQDAVETLNHLSEWIDQFREAFERERKRPDVPAEDPRPKTQDPSHADA